MGEVFKSKSITERGGGGGGFQKQAELKGGLASDGDPDNLQVPETLADTF